MFSGENNDRGVYDIGRASGAAEFPTRTSQFAVERNNLDFLAPQKARQLNLNARHARPD